MHGKTSQIRHNNQKIFSEIPDPFEATRYHSLVIEEKSLPECLEVIAWTIEDDSNKEIMAIKHKNYPTYGVQFHPESILTDVGHQIFKNFLEIQS